MYSQEQINYGLRLLGSDDFDAFVAWYEFYEQNPDLGDYCCELYNNK